MKFDYNNFYTHRIITWRSSCYLKFNSEGAVNFILTKHVIELIGTPFQSLLCSYFVNIWSKHHILRGCLIFMNWSQRTKPPISFFTWFFWFLWFLWFAWFFWFKIKKHTLNILELCTYIVCNYNYIHKNTIMCTIFVNVST